MSVHFQLQEILKNYPYPLIWVQQVILLSLEINLLLSNQAMNQIEITSINKLTTQLPMIGLTEEPKQNLPNLITVLSHKITLEK